MHAHLIVPMRSKQASIICSYHWSLAKSEHPQSRWQNRAQLYQTEGRQPILRHQKQIRDSRFQFFILFRIGDIPEDPILLLALTGHDVSMVMHAVKQRTKQSDGTLYNFDHVKPKHAISYNTKWNWAYVTTRLSPFIVGLSAAASEGIKWPHQEPD